jgi:hypothetical protein
MSTTPVIPATPEITINNTAQEIKAALEATAAVPLTEAAPPSPAPAAAAPLEPQPYTVTETPEGVEIKLETGAVYKGKNWAEAATSLARGKVEADKTLHRLNTQQQPAAPQAPAVPVPEVEDPEAATREWLMGQLAKEFKMPVEQFKQAVGQMFQVTQAQTVNVAWTDFAQACPDFVDSPQNAEVLVAYLPQEVVSQQRPFSADDLRRAHAMALYDKKYSAAPTATNPPSVLTPPVMPTAGAGSTPGEIDAYKMPLHELRKAAFQQ